MDTIIIDSNMHKEDLMILRSYAKKMKYRIFYDKVRKMTCIINPRTHKRVFVGKSQNGYITIDDHGNHENINNNIKLCLTDSLGIHMANHVAVKKFVYGIVFIEYSK